ncbi:hypothetical protein BD414DRAFT_103542 [Trametes punicea]|nr:hypothetical protein BD414DRAFT_103542 [Trametes punicea]
MTDRETTAPNGPLGVSRFALAAPSYAAGARAQVDSLGKCGRSRSQVRCVQRIRSRPRDSHELGPTESPMRTGVTVLVLARCRARAPGAEDSLFER